MTKIFYVLLLQHSGWTHTEIRAQKVDSGWGNFLPGFEAATFWSPVQCFTTELSPLLGTKWLPCVGRLGGAWPCLCCHPLNSSLIVIHTPLDSKRNSSTHHWTKPHTQLGSTNNYSKFHSSVENNTDSIGQWKMHTKTYKFHESVDPIGQWGGEKNVPAPLENHTDTTWINRTWLHHNLVWAIPITSLYDAPVVEVSSLSQWPSFMADWPLTTVPVVHCKTKKYCRNSPNCKPQQEWSNYKIQQKFLNAAVLSSMLIHEKPHPAHGLLCKYRAVQMY